MVREPGGEIGHMPSNAAIGRLIDE